jgi:hypothetical protein
MGVPEGTPINIETDFSRPGFLFSMESTDAKWTVRPDRIKIESGSQNEDCGLILAKILDWLPVTPVEAVGHNFQFIGNPDDLPDFHRMAELVPRSEVPGFTIKQRTWHAGLENEGVTFNVQAAAREAEVELLANVQIRPEASAGGQRIGFAKGFFEYRAQIIRLLTGFFAVELSV